MSDTVAIICAPWTESQLMALPGNRTAECGLCHDPVVISREGRRMFKDTPGAVLRCLRCARSEAPDAVVDAVPGAREMAESAGVPLQVSAELVGRPLRELLDENGEWRSP